MGGMRYLNFIRGLGRRRADRSMVTAVNPNLIVVRTSNDLDDMLARFDEAARVSDDERRREFARYRMEFEKDVPKDPYSEEYRNKQFELYKRISGREYSVVNEVSAFNVEEAISRPFPYHTGSCETVGDHLKAIGHAIKTMKLQPGAKVLEFGPGWGNTTLMLAMMGFHVTAVDIENNFCELVTQRAKKQGVNVEVVNDDFSWIENVSEPFDAVFFFECFHHCSDHLRLLKSLHKATKPDGRVYFAAEPITVDFPIPWGLRLDGESLWAIRRNGWLELGFNEQYFIDTMSDLGWIVDKHIAREPGWATVYEAVKANGAISSYYPSDPRIYTDVGKKTSGGEVVSVGAHGCLMYGPYISLGPGSYKARIVFSDSTFMNGTGAVDICHRNGNEVIAKKAINFSFVDKSAAEVSLAFTLDSPVCDLEVRLFCNENAIVGVRELQIILV